jgi:hypothetical protein
MWPGAHRAFLLVDGHTLFNGEWAVSFSACRDMRRIPGPKQVGFDAGRPPCLIWQLGDSLLLWTVSAAVLPTSDEPGAPLLASLEFELRNLDSIPHDASLEARLSRPARYPFVARDGLRLPARALTWRARASADTAAALGPAASRDSVLVMRARLRPSEERHWRFIVASHPAELRALKQAMRLPHAQWKRNATKAWESRFAGAARLALGDPVLEKAAEHAIFVLIGCTEGHPDGTVPIGNPFQYRDTWIRDAARQIAALSQWCSDELACDLAVSLLAFQLLDGGFMSQRGQLDGTGQVLWALDQAFSRASATRAVPVSVVKAVLRAWRWCERERALVRQFAPRFQGLMPPADPRDNELRRGYLVGTDCWTLAGYRSAAALVRTAGDALEAQAIEQSLREYQGTVHARLVALGGSDVPAAWRGPARDWGNLSVVYPCGVLEPFDDRARGLAKRIWASRGRVGLATYGSADSLHSYKAADLATWALLSDQPAVWDSVITDMMRWRTGTGGAPELFSSSTRDFGANLPPHATAAAAFLTTLRNGLVFDELGDTLRLTTGTRSGWWSGSAHLKGAPTRWGRIDISFKLAGGEARWVWTPVPVWTTLRVPPGMRVASTATSSLRVRDAHTLLAPPGTGRAAVRCTFD